jgi:hypothetical protein
MRNTAARSSLISGPAIALALVWGTVEFLALQGSRFKEWLRSCAIRREPHGS